LLKNKVIVVTGGAGLLGQFFVKAISENGGIPIIADINICDAAPNIKSFYDQITSYRLDITSKESVVCLISDVRNRYGRIDAVINNAYPRNHNYGKALEAVDYEDFCENVSTHLGGYFLVSQQFCLDFKKQGHGNIINMSSIYGSKAPRFGVYTGTSMTTPVEYAAIKAAVENLTRYFAQYYKESGIRVNSLSPGGILADQPKSFLTAYRKYCASKGMLDPNDLLGALIFLLSDGSQYMTGQNIIIDDGFTL
jgi:NAD(P)-dependent dehydrogenase (short-subunit alcohol dehydrogenase family)